MDTISILMAGLVLITTIASLYSAYRDDINNQKNSNN